MNVRLNGISFVELPHISKGEEIFIIRENGEEWDSDSRPAYSVRLDCGHIGYIPLEETIKEEQLKAKDGFRKVWKAKYKGMSAEELRKAVANLIRGEEPEKLYDWVFIGKKEAHNLHRRKQDECIAVEMVRDWLYVEMVRNHCTPRGIVSPMYYDEIEGVNFNEIGNICSLSASIDIEGTGVYDHLATETSAALEAERAMRADNQGE